MTCGEWVKAKKENQLRRAYVRAREADSVKALVSEDRRARSGGGERESRPFVRVCSRVLRKAFALPGTLPSGHHGVRFPFSFGVLRCGGDCEGAALSTLRRRGLRGSPDPQEGDDGDQGEAEHVARGDAQHFVHFTAGRQTFEIATALAVEHEENGRQE